MGKPKDGYRGGSCVRSHKEATEDTNGDALHILRKLRSAALLERSSAFLACSEHAFRRLPKLRGVWQ